MGMFAKIEGQAVGAIVDQLGRLQAQIADLEAQADAIKTTLAICGEGAYEGALFRATVSKSERNSLDMKAVRAKLSRQFIAANTNVTAVTSVRVVSKIEGVTK